MLHTDLNLVPHSRFAPWQKLRRSASLLSVLATVLAVLPSMSPVRCHHEVLREIVPCSILH